MISQGREVKSYIDYILGTNHRMFQNAYVQDLRHNTYHYMILG